MTMVLIGGSVSGSVLVWCCSGTYLVLKIALDDLGLGATAGALNPIDVHVIGSQDGLQL